MSTDEPLEKPSVMGHPTLQELKSPTISYKDRKILMWLYDGKLKKPEKLRRLILRGYAHINEKGEVVPTVLGSLLIDFTVKLREKELDARRAKAASRQPSRKNAATFHPERKQPDTRTIPVGELGVGDSGTASIDPLPHIEQVDGHPSAVLSGDVRTERTATPT